VAFASAKGKYLVSLDDDSWFLNEDALEQVCNRFESLPKCGIIAFQTLSPRRTAASAVPLKLVSDHITCGAAYRSDLLRKTGYHVPFLRFMGEEADLSIKAIAEGFDVVLDESIRVFHDFDPFIRAKESMLRIRRFSVRNDLLQSWIYFPIDLAIALTVWRGLSHLAFGIRHGFLGATLRAYAEFLLRLPQALHYRRVIDRNAALRYLRLRRCPQTITTA